MSCEKCRSFGRTRSNYEYFGINISRHVELYRCTNCGQFLEIAAEARAPYFLTLEQANEYFPDARKELVKIAPRK
ncbi:hypothetical protein BAN20980_06480 [Burkholderia anthina]|uniref:Uncharacterized protein n=1 Tax=Burkholderia anthina TaxID=179879 RepID=A0A6P2GLS0_9BURK|nr:hypothetical protein BAN20980_06480 [Burkholderia anthina]